MAVSKRLRYEILRRDNHACRYCGAAAPDVKVTIDHVLPVALGGTDTPDNLVTACADCNSGKTSTTPDAPLVANVAEDALRWAGAMALASREALEDTQGREKAYKAFQKAWKRNGGATSDLPDNWRGSLSSLIAAGLPAEALVECADIAFDQAHVYDRNRFKYMCGVGWRKVDALRKRAEEIVGIQRTPEPQPVEETDNASLEGLIDAFFEEADELDPTAGAHYLKVARKEGEGESELEIRQSALLSFWSDVHDDRDRLHSALTKLMGHFPVHLVEELRARSLRDHKHYLDDKFTEASVELMAANYLCTHLDELPGRREEALRLWNATWKEFAKEVSYDNPVDRHVEEVTKQIDNAIEQGHEQEYILQAAHHAGATFRTDLDYFLPRQ